MNQQPMNPYHNPLDPPPANTDNTNMIVWSVLNLIFCNQILGIIALVFALKAKNPRSNSEWESNNKVAKILNIIATALGALAVVGVIIYILFVVVLAVGVSM